VYADIAGVDRTKPKRGGTMKHETIRQARAHTLDHWRRQGYEWIVYAQYESGNYGRGQIISRHVSYALAARAANPNVNLAIIATSDLYANS
jgi:hypothetical protein